jgi:hypothetical protein
MDQVPVIVAPDAEALIGLLDGRAGERLAVRLPSRLVAGLDDATASRLPGTAWTYLVAGIGDPVLAALPPTSQQLQIGRDIEALTAHGVTDLTGLVARGWDQSLAALFAGAGISNVAVGGGALGEPMVTDHHGAVVTILPLIETAGGPVILTPAGTPPRGQPPPDRAWAAAIDGNPEAAILYRKMLRVASQLGERAPAEALDSLLEAQAASWYQDWSDLGPAHGLLVRAAARLDQERRRGAEWSEVTQLDWDADGLMEVEVQTAALAMVLDPGDGTIPVVDHKRAGRSLSYVPGEGPWQLARLLTGESATRQRFELGAVEETRHAVVVRLTSTELALALTITGEGLVWEYEPQGRPGFDRFGSELVVAFSGPVKMRVDGGQWRPVEHPTAATGHRFRFDDGAGQMLVALDQPGDLFVHATGSGLVAWINWPVRPGSFRLTVSLPG